MKVRFHDEGLPLSAAAVRRQQPVNDTPEEMPVRDDSGWRSDTQMLKTMNANASKFWAREEARSRS